MTTELILLGTGTPNAEPDRSGSALAVTVDGEPYLVDFGPGVVRRANAAYLAGVQALALPNLTRAFLTHLHSDHTAGFPDLILTPWTKGRTAPLAVYGPPGLAAMAEHLLAAYAADIRERLEGLEPANATGHQVEVTEIAPGPDAPWPVYRDDRVSVSAFPVQHGRWPAFGFRFETADRTIVVSGDTAPTPDLPAYYQDCDILVHEVYSLAGFAKRTPEWQHYHSNVHTSTRELAALANQIRPGLLVLVHQLHWGVSDAELVAEIQADYHGDVVSGADLDRF